MLRSLPFVLLLACASDVGDFSAEPSPPPTITLSSTPLWPGYTATFTISGAPAGTTVGLVVTTNPNAAPICPPQLNGSCLNIGAIQMLGTKAAGANGTTTFNIPVPAALAVPSGRFQAAAIMPGLPALVSNVLNAPVVNATTTDTDGDGILDADELTGGTSPVLTDSDGDVLSDYEELFVYQCDPTDTDSDNDTLPDQNEIAFIGSSCTDADSDDDGARDNQEVNLGTDPTNPDTDGGGVNDGTEAQQGRNPLDPADDLLPPDSDRDGLSNAQEQQLGTNPNDSDTDDDGVSDGVEVVDLGSNPRAVDTDGDGLDDGMEYALGTILVSVDSDRDGLRDGDEFNTYGTDPRNEDTDGGGLEDGDEIAGGTDPHDPSDD